MGEIRLDTAGHIRGVEYRGKKNIFQIQTPSRTYYIAGDTPQDRDSWVEALNQQLLLLHPQSPAMGAHSKVGVSDFELLKLVGKGSFAKVMQVKYKATGEIYAMKVLSKQHIVEHREVEHTMAELHILQKLHHPFLVNLHYSFQTEDKLYFILDFINGGELFSHLQHDKKFPLERVRFYAAEICLALEHLHNAGVIYRDLKPENLLLTDEGHIVMTDFGLCKEGLHKPEDKTDTFCGTPEYLAPEILQGKVYNKSVDWWSYGSLVYEMLTGLPPFYSQDIQDMYRRIVMDKLTFPVYVCEEARSMLTGLLERDPDRRLADPNIIKSHPFFAGVDWEAIFQKRVKPPFVPNVRGGKTSVELIDTAFTSETPSHDFPGASALGPLLPSEQQDFANFTYVAQSPSAAGPAGTAARSSLSSPVGASGPAPTAGPRPEDLVQVIHGSGAMSSRLLAKKTFGKGHPILPLRFSKVTRTPTFQSLQISPDTHAMFATSDPLLFVNHSCDPSARFDVERMELIAERDLPAWSEITCFYPSTEWSLGQPFDCTCGSEHCLHHISGAKDVPPPVMLSHYSSTHIRSLKTRQLQDLKKKQQQQQQQQQQHAAPAPPADISH